MALVRFALILLIIYFVVRIFTRYILQSYLKNIKKNFENQQNQYNQKRDGDITIEKDPQKDKKIDKNEGDYIDYEEIKE